MSDHSIAIVPKKSVYDNNETKAEEILEWLISKDIVKPELSDCILSFEKGYAVSDGAKQIVNFPDDLPFDLLSNGLEIITGKEVFHAGESGMEECICSNCNENIAHEEWTFIDEWFIGAGDKSVCPLCNVMFDIHELKMKPQWGFSDLGFKFWNWPMFKTSFIEEFQDRLKCEVVVVRQHI